MTNNALWRALLKAVLGTKEEEMTCQECFGMLNLYADILVAGGDPERVLPRVAQHLRQCIDCKEQLQMLLAMLHQLALRNN